MALDYYKSTIDMSNPSNNGGDITSEVIQDGVLHSFLPAISADDAELGGERYAKFFVKTTASITDLQVCLSSVSKSQSEEVYLFRAGSNTEKESDLDKANLRLYGAFVINSYDSGTKTIIADRDVSLFIAAGDKLFFFDDGGGAAPTKTAWDTVSSVDGNNIVLDNGNIGTDSYYGANVIQVGDLSGGDYTGFWIKDVWQAHAHCDNPPNEFYITSIYVE